MMQSPFGTSRVQAPEDAKADTFVRLERYFLLQAALIPIHCLRRNPTHPEAASWRAQVLTALNVINAMDNLNPSAPKCRDIIHRLCGESLVPQAQSQQETWSTFPPDATFTDAFPFSKPSSNDAGIDAWMTEIDTAIDGYDVYCHRLSNAAVAGTGQPGPEMGGAGVYGSDETRIGTGIQDWDWGLML